MLKRDEANTFNLGRLNQIYLEMVKAGKTQFEESGLKMNIPEVEAPWIFKAMWGSQR